MNKRFVAKIALGILLLGMVLPSLAFEDKPALTLSEKKALLTAKVVAACGGLAAGFGAVNWFARSLFVPNLWWNMGGVLLGSVGAYYGHKVVRHESVHAFAMYHGVGYFIERTSQYYNINIGQYGPLFLNAIAGPDNAVALKQAIDVLYVQRFGAEWQIRMVTLFETYSERAESLLKYPAFSAQNDDIKDFIRMIQLGAAMANLYYRTNPDPRNTISSATTLYKELDLLQ